MINNISKERWVHIGDINESIYILKIYSKKPIMYVSYIIQTYRQFQEAISIFKRTRNKFVCARTTNVYMEMETSNILKKGFKKTEMME